jgi:hypothetical protein
MGVMSLMRQFNPFLWNNLQVVKCQACHLPTKIVDKYEDDAGLTATRRHECSNPDCPRYGPEHRFTTEERITPRSAEEGRAARGESD